MVVRQSIIVFGLFVASILEACGGGGATLPSSSTSVSRKVARVAAASSYLAIDAGGGAATPNWIADVDYSGGRVSSVSTVIDTSRVSNPAPQTVYQAQRWASSLTYTVPNLSPGTPYTVRAHFAETNFRAAGKRIFSVTVNGTPLITNFDIFSVAGAVNTAVVEQVTADADSKGTLTMKLVASVNNATIAGIEVIGASAGPSPTPSPSPIAGLPTIANQVMWYDAADPFTITMNGKTLSQWADKSGNENTVYQNSASSQPTLVASAINGLPGLSFTGGQWLSLSAPNAGSAAAYSVFVAAKNGAPTTYQSILGGAYQAGAGEFGLQSTPSGAARIALTNGTAVANGTPGGFSSTAEVIEGLMSSSSTAALYHTGTADSVASTSVALRTFTSINLGAEPGATNFAGTLGEVIIYNRVLTTTERQEVEGYLAWKWGIQALLPPGHPYKSAPPTIVPPTPAPQAAHPADAMVDSIGINTHFSYNNTAYKYLTSANPAPNGNSIVGSLKMLGVRHIREAIDTANPADPSYCAAMRQAHANGSDFNLLVSPTDTTATWSGDLGCLNSTGAIKSIEGLNEYVKGANDPVDLANDVAMSKQMYSARAAGILPNVPLIAPSQTTCEAYQAELNYSGDAIATYVDDNNSHGYFGEYNPETKPWGGQVCGLKNGYGSMGYQIENSSQPAPKKPLIVTETGYSNGCCGNTDTNQTVDSATQAKYTLRTYLSYYAAGVKNVYVYELATDSQSFGILDNLLNPKPAFTALENFIGILQDPGGTTLTTTPLGYSMQAPADVEQLLFQKRDGSYWLVLWQTDASFNAASNTPITVPPTNVVITFGAAPAALKNWVIKAADGTASAVSLAATASLTLSVSDTPEILQIGTTTALPVTVTPQK